MAARVEIQPVGEVWFIGQERPCGCLVDWFDVSCGDHAGPAQISCPRCEFALLGVRHDCEEGCG
jgi:hypothetical protein